MENIKNFFVNINNLIVGLNVFDYVMMAIVALCFWLTFNMLRKNNAIIVIYAVIIVSIFMGLFFIYIKSNPAYYFISLMIIFCLVFILFSLEVKRIIWNKKVSKKVSTSVMDKVNANSGYINNVINEMTKAIQNMSKNNVGAIIILSNTKMPTSVIDSGVIINSQISAALIESIFFPNTPLHDGAMVIQDNVVYAAGCFLPLSQSTNIPKELGTRHRAGVGITENIDVISIIVSEETGIISIAQSGKFKRYVTPQDIKKLLKDYFWIDVIGK